MTRVSAIEGHRLWAPYYDAASNPLLALESRMLAGVLDSPASKLVVDAGCGTGRWTHILAERGARVIGLDLCSAMLSQAAAKPGLRGRLVMADAARLPIVSGIADITLSSFVIGYVRNLARMFFELSRVTRPQGTVIVSDLHFEAAAAGWSRSFRAAGDVYEMEHVSRSAGEIAELAARSGLEPEFQIHGRFEAPERAIFEAAGKDHVFEGVSRIPAVWIAGWRRR